MGNVSSRLNDGATLYLKDQTRISIAAVTITNAQGRPLLTITPTAFPATRLIAKKHTGDSTTALADFVQDPDTSADASSPSFLLHLSNEDDLVFNFVFNIRQSQISQNTSQSGGSPTTTVDTVLNGLTFIFASNTRDLENLVTREFHADPNLHKNANVELVGDYTTGGTPSVQAEWSWKWRPPRASEDKGGGWRNSCSFVEYDQRAHKLNTLATFSFWVSNTQRILTVPGSPPLGYSLRLPSNRSRIASSQSVDSRTSENEQRSELFQPPSPAELSHDQSMNLTQTTTNSTVINCQRPGEDMSAVEDGPLFRATMKALEQKTGSMRIKMKKVLKKAEAAQQAQMESNDAVTGFIEALREASRSNANAIQPAMEHYFEPIAREILVYERQQTQHLQKMIIDPLAKLYNFDLKQAESKKKDFEEESRDYYAYVGRYLGQRQDSLKEKKRIESDSKYQSKRRNFELKRFDYSSFMQDLHGGRKEQEVLSHLTRYADAQAKGYIATAKKIEEMLPQLEALNTEVKEADKEYRFQRTEREEKRRNLEKSTKTYVEPDSSTSLPPTTPGTQGVANTSYISDAELSRADSSASTLRPNSMSTSGSTLMPGSAGSSYQGAGFSAGSVGASANGFLSHSPSNRTHRVRDIDEPDFNNMQEKTLSQLRKEGLLWALSRPGSHADPKGLNKQAWHKFWIVLDQGKLSEYSNWKQKLDLHMEPIDLRMASVREARNAERRFCFEVITPNYKRVYQATSEEDMMSWISSINNALQSAVEGRGIHQDHQKTSSPVDGPNRRDIGSILTGKPSSHASQHSRDASNSSGVFRRTTVGSRPIYVRSSSNSFEEYPDKLLQIVREADQSNCWCADCGSGIKTEWVSINLGIVLCIECSGIHRSLGTHVSKIRSLTLDTTAFTTDIVELLLQIGNRKSNLIWEATLTSLSPLPDAVQRPPKPSPQASREVRLHFITAKYVQRLFVQALSPTLSRYSTPEETLIASIKKNDLQNVLYALALKANPNTTDKSRNTHSVFLALAAADPAQPGTPPGEVNVAGGKGKAVAFPAAELLVQNGADIPTTPPAFPLSKNAQLYIEQKAARTNTSSGSGNGVDVVRALPSIGENSSHIPSHSQSARERLQKRVSAGGRMGKS